MEIDEALRLIEAGEARLELAGWRLTMAAGEDARAFLHDLLTADVATLEPGRSRRALLLSPTGRIRADVTVAGLAEGLLLVQGPDQPHGIADLLAPYVLSAAVELTDRTGDLSVVAFPGVAPPAGEAGYTPSAVGPGGDVVRPREPAGDPLPGTEVPASAVEAWRIVQGIARFPRDLTERSHPNEAGLERWIDVDKGCFLGQEAVAKIRTLGHPTHAVLAVTAPDPITPGEEVRAGNGSVGEITSAAAGERHAGIVRIRWDARDAELATSGGVPLEVAGLASGPAPAA
jgi:hypothetical protein